MVFFISSSSPYLEAVKTRRCLHTTSSVLHGFQPLVCIGRSPTPILSGRHFSTLRIALFFYFPLQLIVSYTFRRPHMSLTSSSFVISSIMPPEKFFRLILFHIIVPSGKTAGFVSFPFAGGHVSHETTGRTDIYLNIWSLLWLFGEYCFDLNASCGTRITPVVRISTRFYSPTRQLFCLFNSAEFVFLLFRQFLLFVSLASRQ